jgi:hypothetical protein
MICPSRTATPVIHRATCPEESKGTRVHSKAFRFGIAVVVVICTAVVEGGSGVEVVEDAEPGTVPLVDAPDVHAEPAISRPTRQRLRMLCTTEP